MTCYPSKERKNIGSTQLVDYNSSHFDLSRTYTCLDFFISEFMWKLEIADWSTTIHISLLFLFLFFLYPTTSVFSALFLSFKSSESASSSNFQTISNYFNLGLHKMLADAASCLFTCFSKFSYLRRTTIE